MNRDSDLLLSEEELLKAFRARQKIIFDIKISTVTLIQIKPM
ncbi:unnamed protein product [Brassica oleracea]